jgi:hypothetical protein
MLTQAMPALSQALQGALPPHTIRRMMQALGNCNQPLEHRGPVAISPTQARQSGPGFYNAGGSWDPSIVQSITDVASLQNNGGLVDSPGSVTNFTGDSFLFNNNANYSTNLFPTTIINGVIGRDGTNGVSGFNGVDGPPGATGASGLEGAAGRDGAPGAAGAAGRAGAGGAPGEAGQAGARGFDGFDGARGFDGAPGRAGRDARIGNLRIVPGPQRVVVGPGQFLTKVEVTVKEGATIDVPKYTFNADTCELDPDGTEAVTVDFELEVKEFKANADFLLPAFRVVGN